MPVGPQFALALNSDKLLLFVFLVLVIIFMVHSAIVAYHWTTYGDSKTHAFTGTLIHIGIGAAILLIMGGIILF